MTTMVYSHLQGVSLRTVKSNRSRCMRNITICWICHSINLEEFFILQSVEMHQILKSFRQIAKCDCWLRHVCLSVCTSTWNNSAHTVQVFIKFGI